MFLHSGLHLGLLGVSPPLGVDNWGSRWLSFLRVRVRLSGRCSLLGSLLLLGSRRLLALLGLGGPCCSLFLTSGDHCIYLGLTLFSLAFIISSIGIKLILTSLRQLLSLLNHFLLVASPAELSDYLPSTAGSRRELHDSLGEECDIFLGPIGIFNGWGLGTLLFLFFSSSLLSKLLICHSLFLDPFGELFIFTRRIKILSSFDLLESLDAGVDLIFGLEQLA